MNPEQYTTYNILKWYVLDSDLQQLIVQASDSGEYHIMSLWLNAEVGDVLLMRGFEPDAESISYTLKDDDIQYGDGSGDAWLVTDENEEDHIIHIALINGKPARVDIMEAQ